MRIQDIFSSIQGEGIRVGEPSTFIRLTGCNVKCLHCDTKYSWKTDGTDMSLVHILKTIEEQKLCTKAFVITGGEPMLQQEELEELIKLLRTAYPFCNVTIETNGSIMVSETMQKLEYIFWSISPKTDFLVDNTFIAEYKRALEYNLGHLEKIQIKFLLEVYRGNSAFRKLRSDINKGNYAFVDIVVQPLMENGSNDSDEEVKKMLKVYNTVIEHIDEWNELRCRSIRFIGQIHKVFKVQ